MNRKNIFQILSEKIEFNKEVSSLYNLLNKKAIYQNTCLEVINEKFLSWKDRKGLIDFHDGIDRLGLKMKLQRTLNGCDNNFSLDDFLIFSEYICNLLPLVEKSRSARHEYAIEISSAIKDNIKNVLDRINHKVIKGSTPNSFIIIKTNEKSFLAAEKTEDDSTSMQLLEYNRFSLKGDLVRKQEILQSLCKHLMGLKNEIKASGQQEFYKDITFLANNLNIRHNNEIGKDAKEIVVKMTKQEIENWYDKLYDAIVTCIVDLDKIKISSEIKALRKEFANQKTST